MALSCRLVVAYTVVVRQINGRADALVEDHFPAFTT